MRLASERRQSARISIDRPCKFRRWNTLKFEHAHTVNVSTSGVLVDIDSPRPIRIGEELAVAVAWNGSPVLSGNSLVSARVVRATAHEGARQRVALRFAQNEAAAVAA